MRSDRRDGEQAGSGSDTAVPKDRSPFPGRLGTSSVLRLAEALPGPLLCAGTGPGTGGPQPWLVTEDPSPWGGAYFSHQSFKMGQKPGNLPVAEPRLPIGANG